MLNSFNFAIEHGVFHRDQKTSLISLLLKKGKDPLDCSSYRPISLIPCDLKIYLSRSRESVCRGLRSKSSTVSASVVRPPLAHTSSFQEPIIHQCCHIPELQPTWSAQKYKVFSAQRHGWRQSWNPTTTEHLSYRHLSWNVKTGPRNIWRPIFQRIYGLMRWEWLLMDQTDGPLTGSVIGTELHFDSDASKVEVGTGWYY